MLGISLSIVSVCKSNVASCACACTILSLLATHTFSNASACCISAVTCQSVAQVAVCVICFNLVVKLSYSDIEFAPHLIAIAKPAKAAVHTAAIFAKFALFFSANHSSSQPTFFIGQVA
jgi:hypothetical protein